MRLSVLDQSSACDGRRRGRIAAPIRWRWPSTAEALGYHRFWVSEHHNLPTIVGTAPEVLLAAIAARTHAHPHRQRRRDAAALRAR
ncbi:MAG: LLM class flavin-dependent oxidoreductase [Comamonadaceae bacterium]|nr:LLM class flavin-dependent oxidoreductase [Comamonadaceae bacterium]